MAKYLSWISGKWQEVVGLVTSAGAGDAGKLVQTDTNGYLNPTVLPPGVGADTKVGNANGGITIRDLVYMEAAGTIARASAASGGFPAQGWATATVTTGQPVTMQMEGLLTGLSGLTPGTEYFLSDATPGALMPSPGPVTSLTGKFAQYIGTAVSATELNFEPDRPVYLTP